MFWCFMLFLVISIGLASADSATNKPDVRYDNALDKGTLNYSATGSQEDKDSKTVNAECDGTLVTTHCTHEGQTYATYIYHPAVDEVSRVVTKVVYENKVIGYCTRCMDGTFSPSCATGRGACSHHGGVAQWNAPRYGSVPVTVKETVVDVSAAEEYVEKVLAE